jgi:prepilin-type N-terminal cleavage/methylation domain-containing protein
VTRRAGFTLVEVMVSLMIFALLAGAGAAVLGSGAGADALCDPMVDQRGGAYTVGLGLVPGVSVIPRSNTWSKEKVHRTVSLAPTDVVVVELPERTAILLDGSDGWQKHWDITIPLMRPYLSLVAVISSISAMKVFEEVYIMTQGGPLNHSKTVVYYVYEKAFQDLEINYASAIGLVLFLFILILSIINLKISRNTPTF